MIALPEVSDALYDHYRKFESADWSGWVAKSHWSDRIELNPGFIAALFDEDNIIKWYKQYRNRLAEVRWPAPSSDKVSDTSRTVVLKSYESRSVFNVLRSKIGAPRAIRHWNNVWLLNERNINTPQPILLAMPNKGISSQGFLAVETVGKHQRIREIFPRGFAESGELKVGNHQLSAAKFAQICGKYVREIHDSGLVHRDLSGGNILVSETWDGTDSNLKTQFVLLDINRIRVISEPQLDMDYRIQDLERLNIPEPYLEDYYFAYARESEEIRSQFTKFLKYRSGYRRIKETKNPVKRVLLKSITYWPRTG